MHIEMRWLGTACFEIVLPDGKTLVTDPFIDDAVSAPITADKIEGCDYLFLTHGHYDHILDVGKLAVRFDPTIYCSHTVSESLTTHLGVNPDNIRPVTVGNNIHESDLTIEVLQGTHVDFKSEYKRLFGRNIPPDISLMDAAKTVIIETFETDWQPSLIQEWMEKFLPGEQINYVFEPDQGPRIYMAGTRGDQDQLKVAKTALADITLLQVPPANALKGLEKSTAELALASSCRVCIPQHHDPLFKGAKKTDLSKLKTLLSGIRFQELIPGKWYVFDGELFVEKNDRLRKATRKPVDMT